ncbi:MAG: hypothetical protein ABEJ04_01950 [Halobacteriaceae archaeon]
MNDATATDGGDAATRVVVSYPADLSTWGRTRLEERSFRAWLRRSHETATPGDEWAEFLDVGCCGDSLDVLLRVEAVQGGARLAPETEVEYEERAACGVEGGWRVQSRGGPTAGSER